MKKSVTRQTPQQEIFSFVQVTLKHLVVLTLLSMGACYLLFFIYSQYVIPSGDDWGFGANTNGSMSSIGQMVLYYTKFHGRYSGHLILAWVMGLEPFLPAYHMAVFLSYLLLLSASCYLSYIILRPHLSLLQAFIGAAAFLSYFLAFQGRPSETYFWFSQICNYILPNVFGALSLALLWHSNLLEGYKKSCLTAASYICAMICIGCSEPPVFLHTSVAGCLFIYFFLIDKSEFWPSYLRYVLTCVFFALVSSLAPGISARFADGIATRPLQGDLWGSLLQGLNNTYRHFDEHFLAASPFYLLSIVVFLLFSFLPLLRMTSKHALRLALSLCVPFFVVAVMYVAGTYTSGSEAPIAERVTPPIDFYLYLYWFCSLYSMNQLIRVWIQRFVTLSEAKVSLILLGLVLFPLASLASNIVGHQRYQLLATYLPHLGQYAKEQEFRFARIAEARKRGDSEVTIPRLSSRPPLTHWDVEDTDEFGFRQAYANFQGIGTVRVEGHFQWHNNIYITNSVYAKETQSHRTTSQGL